MKSVIPALAILVSTAIAYAQPGPAGEMPLPAAPAPTESEWYGWQMLLADGGTIGLAAASGDGALALGWLGTGATIHAVHHNYGRSVLSVGLRVGLPFIAGSVAASGAHGCTGNECELGAAVGGVLIGMGIAEVIDVSMASEEHEVVPRAPSRGWTPVATLRSSGATFGIAARF